MDDVSEALTLVNCLIQHPTNGHRDHKILDMIQYNVSEPEFKLLPWADGWFVDMIWMTSAV